MEHIQLLEYDEGIVLSTLLGVNKREMIKVLKFAYEFLDDRFRGLKAKKLKIGSYTHDELAMYLNRMLQDEGLRLNVYRKLTRDPISKTIYDMLMWEHDSVSVESLPLNGKSSPSPTVEPISRGISRSSISSGTPSPNRSPIFPKS
jgi:hypothetical protein